MSDIAKMIAIAKKFGGGSSGGNAGGGGVFVITAGSDSLTDTSFSATIDKTFTEIEAAHNGGQVVQMRLDIMGLQLILPLTGYLNGGMAVFLSMMDASIVSITVTADNSATGQLIMLATQG